jgi:hypothetical protein
VYIVGFSYFTKIRLILIVRLTLLLSVTVAGNIQLTRLQ